MKRREWKKAAALFMVCMLCFLAVTGCSKKEETAGGEGETVTEAESGTENTGSGEKKYKFGFSSKQMSNPFQKEIVTGAEAAYDQSNTELVILDANSDAAKQSNDFDDMIEMGCDVILFVPYDSLGLEPALKKAHDAGIILINLDNPVDDSSAQYVDATIVSDNYQAGQLCADYLAEALDEKGDIGAYTVPTSLASTLRSSGFFDTLEEKYPDIQVVSNQTGASGATDVALPVMENILQAVPDIVGMFGYCDTAAQGCISAIKSAGKLDQIKVVSVDGSTDGKIHIENGEMLGSAAQFPGEMSKMGIEAAYALLNGEQVEKEIYIPTQWVNKDNVNEIHNFSE